nr:hypothetical protein [Alphaproteobacteria bacterium]
VIIIGEVKLNTQRNHMEAEFMWNALLSIGVTAVGFWVKSWVGEVTRLQILLNRTREEYITKADSSDQMNRVMNRLDGLDAKIDRLIERQ